MITAWNTESIAWQQAAFLSLITAKQKIMACVFGYDVTVPNLENRAQCKPLSLLYTIKRRTASQAPRFSNFMYNTFNHAHPQAIDLSNRAFPISSLSDPLTVKSSIFSVYASLLDSSHHKINYPQAEWHWLFTCFDEVKLLFQSYSKARKSPSPDLLTLKFDSAKWVKRSGRERKRLSSKPKCARAKQSKEAMLQCCK